MSLPLPSIGEANTTADQKVLDILTQTQGSLTNSNLSGSAGITGANIATGTVDSTNIKDGAVADTDLASPNNGAYRQLFSSHTAIYPDAVAGTYILLVLTSFGFTIASGGNVAFNDVPYFYFASADYAVTGKTQKLRLRAQVAANATQPTITFTFGLYPITVAGGTDALTMTLGTVVTGSTVAIASPAASTVTSGVNSDFTVPSDGAYALGVVTSGTLTNNSAVLLSAQLQSRNV